MSTNEILNRLNEARQNTSRNVNCIGLVLFVLGIAEKERSFSLTAYTIGRNLEVISKGFTNNKDIPSEASVIGFWSTEGKFYSHLALLVHTDENIVEVYEREGHGQNVRLNTIPSLIQEYVSIWGNDQVEVHFLRQKFNR